MKWKFVVCLLFFAPLALVMAFGCPKAGNVSEIDDGANRSRRPGGGSGKSQKFEELLPIGAQASDFTLETLEGATVSLRSLKGKIVVLVTGARTSPAFLIWVNSMDEIYKAYQGRDDVQFLYLYTREPFAGAIPGYGWSMRDISQPKTYDERKQYAFTCQKEHRIDIPILIDTMDGAVHKAYGYQPNSVVIIDREGRIAARRKWNDPLFVELALRDMVIDPPEVKQVETMLSCGQCHEDRVRTIDEDQVFDCGSCHSMQKARRGLKSPEDRSHRKTNCDRRCHQLDSEPYPFEEPGPTGKMRDLFMGAPPLYEEPGLAFTHLPHMNSGRFAYFVNFCPFPISTTMGSCVICHPIKEEKCTKCHGANPHEFHDLFENEMNCHECHTTPGKARND